jgi:hypothetical protein
VYATEPGGAPAAERSAAAGGSPAASATPIGFGAPAPPGRRLTPAASAAALSVGSSPRGRRLIERIGRAPLIQYRS